MLTRFDQCKHFFLGACFLLFPFLLFSQTKIIDSLQNELKKTPKDSAEVLLFTALANEYYAYDTLKAWQYLEKGHHLAKKMNWDYAVGDHYFVKATLKQFASDHEAAHLLFDTAIIYLNKTINSGRPRKEVEDAKLIMATCLGQKADVLLKRGKSEEAITVYLAALEAWRASAQPRKNQAIAIYYTKISSTYYELKQYDKALVYDKLSLSTILPEKNEELISWAYIYVSDDFNALDQIDSCLQYLTTAKPIVERLNNHRLNVQFYNKLGQVSSKKKEYRSAIKYYEKSIDEARITNTKYDILSNQRMIGISYVRLGEYATARKVLLTALPAAITGNYAREKMEILQELATVEEKTNHPGEAYNYLKQVTVLRDSVNQENSRKAVAEIENKYQAGEKAKEIVQLNADKQIQSLSLKQKSTLNFFLVSAIAAILILSFLVYRNLHHRHTLAKQQDVLHQQRIRELEKDKQLVAVDSMLKGQEEERSRMARDLHDGLGGMLSGVKLSLGAMKGNIVLSEDNTRLFTKVLDQLDHSINEMRRVAHNMMPEALVKFGLQQAIHDYCDGLNESNNLLFKKQFYGLEKRLDTATEIVVYRIVQELLNNVIKHAKATEVFVQVMRQDKNLNITIEDNGAGFIVGDVEYKKSAGLGNVRSRVDYLKGQFDIQSIPGSGTSIHIECTVPIM